MNTIKLSEQYLEVILKKLGVEAIINVEQFGPEEGLEVDTKDQALLIGKKGENLKSLQYLVGQMVKKSEPEAKLVTIDVAGYKKERLKKLDVMVSLAKSQALATSQPVELLPMNAYERRYVHNIVSNDKEILSESSGEEPLRRVIIRKS